MNLIFKNHFRKKERLAVFPGTTAEKKISLLAFLISHSTDQEVVIRTSPTVIRVPSTVIRGLVI